MVQAEAEFRPSMLGVRVTIAVRTKHLAIQEIAFLSTGADRKQYPL